MEDKFGDVDQSVTSEVVLTHREREILRLAADHKTNKEIADELSICVKTVEKHLSAVYSKFDVNRRRYAIQKARDLNLLG
jgi:DNA-binding CsgD family transcriptional regulator